MTYIIYKDKLLYYDEICFQQLMRKLKLIHVDGYVYTKPLVMYISINFKIVLIVMFTQK